MKHHYNDIRELLGTPPWWDEVGVPRYCKFGPDETNCIYANEVVLFAITCQNCGHSFVVALSWHPLHDCHSLKERIEQNTLHYGDPPNIGCCASGATMNSIPKHIIQFWHKPEWDWKRVPELERAIVCEWA